MAVVVCWENHDFGVCSRTRKRRRGGGLDCVFGVLMGHPDWKFCSLRNSACNSVDLQPKPRERREADKQHFFHYYIFAAKYYFILSSHTTFLNPETCHNIFSFLSRFHSAAVLPKKISSIKNKIKFDSRSCVFHVAFGTIGWYRMLIAVNQTRPNVIILFNKARQRAPYFSDFRVFHWKYKNILWS